MITIVARFTVFWCGMTVAALGPLLPELRTIYHVSVVDISWVFTLLLIGSAVGLAILPRLADIVGDRFVMTLLPTMLAAGLALAATGSFAALLVGVLGIGVGGISPPIVIAALRRTLPGESIGRAVYVAMGSVLVGSGVGYFVGGIIEGHLSVREFFIISAIVSAAVAVAVHKVFPHAPAADRGSLGIASVALLVGWVVAFLFAISNGPAWGWTDPKTLGLIVASFLMAVIWARREGKIDTPSFDMTLLRSNQFRRTLVGAVTLGMGGSAFSVLFPMFAQIKGAGYGPGATLLQTGFIMLPYAVVGMIGAAITARLVPRGRALLAAGIGALGHCGGALSVAFFHDNVWQLFVGAAIYGIGIGMVNSGLFSSIQTVVGKAKAGMANSALGVTVALAGAVGPIIYSIILGQKSAPGLPGVPAESQFFIAFLVNAAVDLCCAVVCFGGVRSSALRPLPAGGDQGL
jgi:MFS family permease